MSTSSQPTTPAPAVSNNQPTSTTLADGLIIQDEVVGTGDTAETGDTVTVNYIGTFQNGTKFDSSYDREQPFNLSWGRNGN